MLHTDFRGVFDLLVAAVQRRHQPCGSHRTGHANLALTSHLRAGYGRVLFVEHAHRSGSEQKAHDAVIVGAGFEATIIMEYRRHDPGCAVRWRRDHLTAGRVFFVDGEREYIDPIERMHRARGIAAHELAI